MLDFPMTRSMLQQSNATKRIEAIKESLPDDMGLLPGMLRGISSCLEGGMWMGKMGCVDGALLDDGRFGVLMAQWRQMDVVHISRSWAY